MARQPFTEKKLTQLLRDYWLATGRNVLSCGIRDVVTAYLYPKNTHVMVSLDKGTVPIVDISPTLDALGIKCRVSWSEAKLEVNERLVIVPGMVKRLADFELLLPFYVERCVSLLSKERPCKLSGIEGTFLLVLPHLLSYRNRTMENIVTDAVKDARSGILRLSSSSPPMQVAAITAWQPLETSHPVVSMYMGVDFSSWTIPRILTPEAHLVFSYADIGLAARNMYHLWRLTERDVDKKVIRCLRLRLDGESERQICLALFSGDTTKYDDFLTANHIGLTIANRKDILKPKQVMKRWEKARDTLFEGHEELRNELFEIGTPLVNSAAGRPALVAAHTTESHSGATTPFQDMSDLTWDEVSITFISNDAVSVEARGVLRRLNYTQMGCCDGRKGDQPDSRWVILREIARHGEISWQNRHVAEKTRSMVKIAVKDIRKRLRESLGIKGDPFHPYRRTGAYRPRFSLSIPVDLPSQGSDNHAE